MSTLPKQAMFTVQRRVMIDGAAREADEVVLGSQFASEARRDRMVSQRYLAPAYSLSPTACSCGRLWVSQTAAEAHECNPEVSEDG